jgi:glucose/arabinose dehydrogenase
VELERRAGIWKYSADKQDQQFTPAERYATGIRNAVGLTVEPGTGKVFTTQHGRDQLFQNWGSKGYTVEQSAELPAEEFMEVNQGDDFGWPYCYYDQFQKKLVLAPEYGGDGGKAVGRCAQKKGPAVAFPGHWAPMASGKVSGAYETFADGFVGTGAGSNARNPATHRPVGLAQAPDGGVYVTDDAQGRIWKIVYTGK